MFARSRLPLSALLAVTVSLSPSLSWYAYADQFSNSQGVNDAVSQPAEESPDGGGDGAGFAGEFNSGQPDSSGEDGSAAGEGLAGDFETSEEAGQDTSEADGGIDLTGSLPLYSSSSRSAVGIISQAWTSIQNTVQQSWNAVKDYLTWFYDGGTSWQTNISTADKVKIIPQFTMMNLLKQQWGYNYGTGNTVVWATNSPAGWLHSINDLSERIRINTNLTQDYLASVRNYLKATAGDGVEYSAAAYLRNTRQDTNLIRSYLVANGNDGVPYSAASWLKSAVDELRSIDTLTGYIRVNTNLTQSFAERAGNFLKAKADDGVEYSAASYLHTLAKNSNILLGYSRSTGSDGVVYSFTGFLNMIAERTRASSTMLDYITKGPEGSRVSLYSIGSAIETIKNETRDLDNLLSDAVDILVSLGDRVAGMDSAFGVRLASIGLSIGDIGDLLESQKGVVEEISLYTSRHVLDVPEPYSSYTLWDLLYSLMSDSDNVVRLLVGLQQSITAWADRWDSAGKDESWSDADKLSLFAKLDGISNRLSVMAAKDVLDTLVGDLDFTRLAALSADVEGAISSAFPFCIPAVLKQVLGLVAADPVPPCWEFDIAGEPLLCDFAPFQPVADVTGWVARVCFVFALLVNTRRFVYMGGGAE